MIIFLSEMQQKMDYFRTPVQKLCEGNRIEGVIRFGHSWMVPKDAKKPVDLRMKKFEEWRSKG